MNSLANHKNLLQEHCQKNNYLLPVYQSKSRGRQHELLWKANVICCNNKYVAPGEYRTKQDAEQEAAKIAYNAIVGSLSNKRSPVDPRFLSVKSPPNTESKSGVKLPLSFLMKPDNVDRSIYTNPQLVERDRNIIQDRINRNIMQSSDELIALRKEMAELNERMGKLQVPNKSINNNHGSSPDNDNYYDDGNESPDDDYDNGNEYNDDHKTNPIITDLPSTGDKAPEYIILIDLENIQPNFSANIKNILHLIGKFYIRGFLSSYSSVDTKKYDKLLEVVKIDSGVTNAADHLMTFYAGAISMNCKSSTTFIIVSRDRASEALASLLQTKFHVIHFKSAKDFDGWFEDQIQQLFQ